MNSTEQLNRFDLRRSFSCSEYAKNGNTFLYFEQEVSNANDGFQSDIIIGRIIYKDKSGHIYRSPSLLVKIFPSSSHRTAYTELTFTNEIFVYSRVLPFFASLNNSIGELFPKFYLGDLIFGENEDGSVVLENLRELGYCSSKSRIFLDIGHLSLMMKKLGEFHAYSYYAKNNQAKKFYSLVDGLVESNFTAMKYLPGYLQGIQKIYWELLSKDRRYADKVKKFEEAIKNADEFCEEVFNSRNEPVAVICHGDFLRNNVLFKYDTKMNPIDMKFIDMANMRYCTPIVDLGLVLYMNTDQRTRDEYWDWLLDVYYESLKSTFPGNKVPAKIEILSEFERNVLQPYIFTAMFLPVMLEIEKNPSPDWFDDIFEEEYEEYKGKPFSSIPIDIVLNVIGKYHRGESGEFVLDVMKDILNKGFI